MADLIWKAVGSTDAPDRRAAHTAIIYEKIMYIFGGWNGLHALDDLISYRL